MRRAGADAPRVAVGSGRINAPRATHVSFWACWNCAMAALIWESAAASAMVMNETRGVWWPPAKLA